MRITSKGQVTIPIEIRERLGLLPDTEVDFEVDGRAVRITRAKQARGRGQAVIAGMRRHPIKSGWTTEKLMQLTRGDK